MHISFFSVFKIYTVMAKKVLQERTQLNVRSINAVNAEVPKKKKQLKRTNMHSHKKTWVVSLCGSISQCLHFFRD